MTTEWGICHSNTIGDLHRGPMTREEAEQWIAEWLEDGGRRGAFVIVSRAVSEWSAKPPKPLHVCQRFDTTMTMCDLPSAGVAAVNFSSFDRARGPFCGVCECSARRALTESKPRRRALRAKDGDEEVEAGITLRYSNECDDWLAVGEARSDPRDGDICHVRYDQRTDWRDYVPTCDALGGHIGRVRWDEWASWPIIRRVDEEVES